MAILPEMVLQTIHGTREERISAAVALVMWFAAGAFVTSTFVDFVVPHLGNNLTSVAGGVLAALLALKFA